MPGRGFSRPARLYASRLLALTRSRVASASCGGVGHVDDRDRAEMIVRVLALSRSARGWLSEPWPLTLATNSFLPSARDAGRRRDTSRSGSARRRVLVPAGPIAVGTSAPGPRRTTATQLLVPLAT